MYKIGDKVETPQFTGVVEKVYESGVKVNGKMFPLKNITPYRTAHEKLIEMGLHLKVTKNYAGGVFSHEWWNENDDRIITFYIDEKLTTVYEGNNEIMKIIPQYLEELNHD